MQKDYQNYVHGTPPDNNLVWAILSTVLCCLPTGIYAIVKAAEVESKWNAGDYEGAHKSAKDALNWSVYGAIATGILIVIYLLTIVIPFIVIIGKDLFS